MAEKTFVEWLATIPDRADICCGTMQPPDSDKWHMFFMARYDGMRNELISDVCFDRKEDALQALHERIEA